MGESGSLYSSAAIKWDVCPLPSLTTTFDGVFAAGAAGAPRASRPRTIKMPAQTASSRIAAVNPYGAKRLRFKIPSANLLPYTTYRIQKCLRTEYSAEPRMQDISGL